jgi:hypothetical protein
LMQKCSEIRSFFLIILGSWEAVKKTSDMTTFISSCCLVPKWMHIECCLVFCMVWLQCFTFSAVSLCWLVTYESTVWLLEHYLKLSNPQITGIRSTGMGRGCQDPIRVSSMSSESSWLRKSLGKLYCEGQMLCISLHFRKYNVFL